MNNLGEHAAKQQVVVSAKVLLVVFRSLPGVLGRLRQRMASHSVNPLPYKTMAEISKGHGILKRRPFSQKDLAALTPFLMKYGVTLAIRKTAIPGMVELVFKADKLENVRMAIDDYFALRAKLGWFRKPQAPPENTSLQVVARMMDREQKVAPHEPAQMDLNQIATRIKNAKAASAKLAKAREAVTKTAERGAEWLPR